MCFGRTKLLNLIKADLMGTGNRSEEIL